MKSQFDQLKQEIQSYERELAKLQLELTEVTKSNPQPQSNSPSSVAQAVRAAVQQTVEQQPVIKGIRDAIAALTEGIRSRQQQIVALEKQQQHQARLQRIEIGKAKVRVVGEELNGLSAQTQAKLLGVRSAKLSFAAT